jgi:hypothetical protein
LERLGCLVPTSGPLVIEVRIISAVDRLIVYRIRSTWDADPNSPAVVEHDQVQLGKAGGL